MWVLKRSVSSSLTRQRSERSHIFLCIQMTRPKVKYPLTILTGLQDIAQKSEPPKVIRLLLTCSGSWEGRSGQPWAAPSSCDWGWNPARAPSSWSIVFWRVLWKRDVICPHGKYVPPLRLLRGPSGPRTILTCKATCPPSSPNTSWACSLPAVRCEA